MRFAATLRMDLNGNRKEARASLRPEKGSQEALSLARGGNINGVLETSQGESRVVFALGIFFLTLVLLSDMIIIRSVGAGSEDL